MKMVCSEKTASVLCNNTYGMLKNFKWKDLLKEMRVHASTAAHILQSCTGKSRKNGSSAGSLCFHFIQELLFKNEFGAE